ncbi:hypothetical protein FSP39_008859 [Pinctada imbricata]|uniref:Glucose-methanol-choline oxidoreductase C-terminal domain-containing protein n=1 Tax=Pinctada imbricata TaxID=66713 RepID=A0AA89BSI7_PINIB|nr:hypothetical protein FSP39_008859 [Pinctada imbricata]
MWRPWAKTLSKKIAEATGLPLEKKVFEVLGYCTEKEKVLPGLLAEATSPIIKAELTKMLIQEGVEENWARQLINEASTEGKVDDPEHMKTLGDLKTLFKILRANDIKIAVCTSDNRKGTIDFLKEVGLEKYIDHVTCGDDPGSEPKPSPSTAWNICKNLGIEPSDAVIVGDTKTDMLLGHNANLGWSVGVLSGVGQTPDLLPHASHVITDIDDLLPIILPHEDWKSCYAYSDSKRILMEPHDLEESEAGIHGNATVSDGHQKMNVADVELVILDLHGTLLCTHDRYSDFLEYFDSRLRQVTGMNLKDKLYREVGMDQSTNKLTHGLLADGSMSQVKGSLVSLLRKEGYFYEEAVMIVNQIWKESQNILLSEPKALHPNIKAVFKKLKKCNVKIAISTGESRESALSDLLKLDLMKYVDMMVCGDDPNSDFTEGTDTQLICEELRVNPSKVMVVGDSIGDLTVSSKAQVKKRIGVLSGVGTLGELEPHADHVIPDVLDIPVVQHLPGVGQNLQDHLEVYVQQECTKPVTLYTAQWKFPHNMIKIGMEWFIKQTGDGATAHLESGGFIRSRPGVDHPDIQFHFLPSTVNDHGRVMGDRHAFQVHVGPMRPTSRGFMKLKSRNPRDHPTLVANYLTTEQDIREMRDSIKLSREIFQQKAFDEFSGPELLPGADVKTDAQLDEYNRNMADSAYHPSCTCKMGSSSDPMAVVDAAGKVYGIDGLRVVDASVMPSVASGNLNGPTVMVAEKMADAILGKQPLPKSTAPVYRPKTLETQR